MRLFAAPSSPSPVVEEPSSAESFDQPTNCRKPAWWRRPEFSVAGVAALGVIAPCLFGLAIVMLFPPVPPLALLPPRPTGEAVAPRATSADPAISPAGGGTAAMQEEPRVLGSDRGVPGARVRPQFNEDRSLPAPAALPMTSRKPGAAVDIDRRIAAVERETNALTAELGRLERQQSSPQRANPPPPPTVAASPVPSTVASPDPSTSTSTAPQAAENANRNAAAVERAGGASTAEVSRVERQPESTSPEPPKPPPPLAVVASPVPPPEPHAGSDIEALARESGVFAAGAAVTDRREEFEYPPAVDLGCPRFCRPGAYHFASGGSQPGRASGGARPLLSWRFLRRRRRHPSPPICPLLK